MVSIECFPNNVSSEMNLGDIPEYKIVYGWLLGMLQLGTDPLLTLALNTNYKTCFFCLHMVTYVTCLS